MKLSRTGLRRLILKEIRLVNEDVHNKDIPIDIKKTEIFVAAVYGEGLTDSEMRAHTGVIVDKISKIIDPKRVIFPKNLLSFLRKKGLNSKDIFNNSGDLGDATLARELGIPVIYTTFGKSPGFSRDGLMRYSLDVFGPNGDLLASNAALDVSSDVRSHEQIKTGLTTLCREAGLIL